MEITDMTIILIPNKLQLAVFKPLIQFINITPTTDTKPSESAQTDTNGQAAYHEVVTKAETQKVIDRRGVPTYQATAELPNTGDDNTATFTLMGLAITAMGMFGAIKLKGRKDC